jgi:RimJ/RimL family protein N-acetyltransferase
MVELTASTNPLILRADVKSYKHSQEIYPMPHYIKLSGDKCALSPVSLADAESWASWLNDLEVTLPLGDEAYIPYSLEKTKEDLNEAIRRQDHVFTILEKVSGRAIGRCLLFGIDSVNRGAMMGIFIGEKDHWGLGYGQEATRLLLDYAFNLLNLHSVMLGVFDFNIKAIRTYEKVGFRKIGSRREGRIIAGKAHDVILMDMLEDEFRARFPSTLPLP